MTSTCLLLGSLAGEACAESRSFPYEATVRSAEVEVRSGPGQRYYVTGRLKLNDRVTVHRHDPGGWFMIAPPPGSFSYIDAALVRREGENTGVVEAPPSDDPNAPRPIVRIGSEFGDEHSFYGRELANGDTVQILGEKMLNTDRGAVRVYRIAPPALEYRWVKGDFIVAAGEELRPQAVTTSFEVRPAMPPATAAIRSEVAPFVRPARAELPAPTATATGPTNASGLKEAVTDLDLRYLELIQQSPEHWDLDGLVRDYEAIRPQTEGSLRDQIDERLAALESRQKIWTDYLEFVQLTTATSQRDAALLGLPPGAAPAAGGTTQIADPALAPASGVMSDEGVQPAAFEAPAAAAPQPKLNGAGIVQRMPTGPRGQFVHVLTSPQGQVLAVLQAAPQLGLDQYVGRSLGVIGRRQFDPRRGVDVIDVRQILPVQLAR
jgi:hypothetical protein